MNSIQEIHSSISIMHKWVNCVDHHCCSAEYMSFVHTRFWIRQQTSTTNVIIKKSKFRLNKCNISERSHELEIFNRFKILYTIFIIRFAHQASILFHRERHFLPWIWHLLHFVQKKNRNFAIHGNSANKSC